MTHEDVVAAVSELCERMVSVERRLLVIEQAVNQHVENESLKARVAELEQDVALAHKIAGHIRDEPMYQKIRDVLDSR
jgi:hypothetical protein